MDSIRIAEELLKIARMFVEARLNFRTEEDYNDYRSKHVIKETTTVYVNGVMVQRGKDKTHAIVKEEDGHVSIHDDGRRLPNYPREKVERHLKQLEDGKSDETEEKNTVWRSKCKTDAEKTNPGICEKADEEYGRLDKTERDALRAYTLRDFYHLNKTFFAVYQGKEKELDEVQVCETKRLMRILKKLPEYHGTVYRSMNFPSKDDLNKFKAEWKNGNSPFTGFVSTSYNPSNYNLYLDGEQIPCVIRIVNSSKGRYIGHLSSTPRDEEILFDCNQRFMLVKEGETKYKPISRKHGICIITVKEVDK